jgi:hypothetical protein
VSTPLREFAKDCHEQGTKLLAQSEASLGIDRATGTLASAMYFAMRDLASALNKQLGNLEVTVYEDEEE